METQRIYGIYVTVNKIQNTAIVYDVTNQIIIFFYYKCPLQPKFKEQTM